MLEHCCDPLIQVSGAGGVRGEERWFSVWLSLLIAGKNRGECSVEGDGLRAEGETKNERKQTPSARVYTRRLPYGSGVCAPTIGGCVQ